MKVVILRSSIITGVVAKEGVNLDFPPLTQKFARLYEGERALKSFEIQPAKKGLFHCVVLVL